MSSIIPQQLRIPNNTFLVGSRVDGQDNVGTALYSDPSSSVGFTILNTGIRFTVNQDSITPAQLLTANQSWDFTGATEVKVPAPYMNSHAATKEYVDTLIQQISPLVATETYTVTATGAATYTIAGSVPRTDSDGDLVIRVSLNGVSLTYGTDFTVGTSNGDTEITLLLPYYASLGSSDVLSVWMERVSTAPATPTELYIVQGATNQDIYIMAYGVVPAQDSSGDPIISLTLNGVDLLLNTDYALDTAQGNTKITVTTPYALTLTSDDTLRAWIQRA
jgi:hypothetical protein